MTSVTVLPIPNSQGGVIYSAASNGKRSQGATVGQAIDALRAQLTDDEGGTMVIVQDRRPDQFFTLEQQNRLAELMARWRTCRDGRQTLAADEQAELDALVDAELRGAAARSAFLADELKR